MKKLLISLALSLLLSFLPNINAASTDTGLGSEPSAADITQRFNCVFSINGAKPACSHCAEECEHFPCVFFCSLTESPDTPIGPRILSEIRRYKNLPVDESTIGVAVYGIESTPGTSIHSGWRVATAEEITAFWSGVAEATPEEVESGDMKQLLFSVGRLGGYVLKISYDEFALEEPNEEIGAPVATPEPELEIEDID